MVATGLDRIQEEPPAALTGGSVGLITNHSAVDADLRAAADVLADRVDLTRLFGPEHGIRGREQAGESVEDSVDEPTGISVTSLYGDTRRPGPDQLASLDVLCYDIQGVGVRYYTYLYTLAYAIEAAAEADPPLVVLDRPNPIAPLPVAGNRISPGASSFVGGYELPIVHGMTVGEFADYVAGEFVPAADVRVLELDGWSREQWFEDTGLPWVPPSPNMPTVDTARCYPGTCLFEGTNCSEGRGTTKPFEQVGAPWIDPQELAAALDALGLSGVGVRPTSFTPQFHKHEGESCGGVQVHVRDPDAFDPVRTGIALLATIMTTYSATEWRGGPGGFGIDRLAGGPELRSRIDELSGPDAVGDLLDALAAEWRADVTSFREARAPYLRY